MNEPLAVKTIDLVNGRLPTLAFGVSWDATVARTDTHAASALLREAHSMAPLMREEGNPFFVAPPDHRTGFVDLQAIVVALRAGGAYLAHVDGDAQEALDGALGHTGDDKTGLGEGWDELCTINLGFLPPEADSVALFAHCKSAHTLAEAKNGKAALFSLRDQGVLLDTSLAHQRASTHLMALLRRYRDTFLIQPVQATLPVTTLDDALAAIARAL